MYDIDDILASGQVEISGWAPTGVPQLVSAGAHDANLANLLSAAAGIGMRSELDALDAAGVAGLAGAAAPAAASPAAIANAIAQKRVADSLLVTQQRPTKAREFPLGFESPTTIAPGDATCR